MSRAGLVPVHDEPGGITFKYEVTRFNFASSIKSSVIVEDADNAEDDGIRIRIEDASGSGDDAEAVPDFLGFEPEVNVRNNVHRSLTFN
jgi:hypothetical protein